VCALSFTLNANEEIKITDKTTNSSHTYEQPPALTSTKKTSKKVQVTMEGTIGIESTTNNNKRNKKKKR
jgi:hypothetical protein